MTIATLIGLVGVVIVLVAYWLLASGRMSNDDWRYPVINIVGTLGIVVSLFESWNPASMVAQLVWIAISIVGLMRIAKKRGA